MTAWRRLMSTAPWPMPSPAATPTSAAPMMLKVLGDFPAEIKRSLESH